jgi:cellulose synthase (UDP-forming)
MRTVGFFQNPKIGCVQTPHHFFNKDPIQTNLKLTNLWPDEQRLFFEAIMPCRDAWDVAFNCGSGVITRRVALTRIGGMPTQSITEDMLTTLVQIRHGWITRYLDEHLSLGLAPETVNAYFVQRHRWCRGQIQIMFLKAGPFGPGLTFLQRLFFIPAYWFIQVPSRLFMMCVPLVFLWFGLAPFDIGAVETLAAHILPLIIAHVAAMRFVASHSYMPFVTTASNLFTAIRIAPTAIASMVKPFGVGFKVTPKGRGNQRLSADRATLAVSLIALTLTVGGILVNLDSGLRVIDDRLHFATGVVWVLLNAVTFVIVLMMALEAPRPREEERFTLNQPGRVLTGGSPLSVTVTSLSSEGAALSFLDRPLPALGSRIILDMPTIGPLLATVGSTDHTGVAITFDDGSEAARRLERGALPAGMPRDMRATCIVGQAEHSCHILDASVSGAAIIVDDGTPLVAGEAVRVHMPGVGVLDSVIVRRKGDGVAIRFQGLAGPTRDRLIQRLYTEGLHNNPSGAIAPSALLPLVIGRALGMRA